MGKAAREDKNGALAMQRALMSPEYVRLYTKAANDDRDAEGIAERAGPSANAVAMLLADDSRIRTEV
jgi:hypothetical protein